MCYIFNTPKSFKSCFLIALTASLWGSTSIAVQYLLSISLGLLTIIFTLTFMKAILFLTVNGKIGIHRIRMDLLLYGIIIVPLFRLLYTLSVQVNGQDLQLHYYTLRH